MSFFDDDDGEAPPTATRVPPRTPRPRRPSGGGRGGAPDRQTLMVRRGVALGVALVVLVLIIIGISGCLRSQARDALKSYNRNASSVATDSVTQVGEPLFKQLSGASGKSALDVEFAIDQLKLTAQQQTARARGFDVPGDMSGAQRNLLLTLDLRSSAVGKIADQIRTALGSGSGRDSAINQIAGQMEVLLASDVIYSQRVAPLIQQVLNDNGIHDQVTAPSRFVTDLGWLDPNTVSTRITGQGGTSSTSGPVAPGPHGHHISGVSVGSNTLTASPAVNQISGGSNPTFTVQVTNGGASPETNVKVDVTVEAGGKKLTASKTIDRTTPGNTVSVDIPVAGVPLSTSAKITAYVEPVPGETDTAHNKQVYTGVFGP